MNGPQMPMNWRFAFAFAAAAIAVCCPLNTRALAQPQPDWDSPEFKLATDMYRRGDCASAWDLMWPMAKAGKYEAVYFLWSTTVDRMVPPALPITSQEARDWHWLTLSAYAAAGPTGSAPFGGDPNHRWATKEIPLLLNRVKRGEAGQRVAQCFSTNSQFKQCLNLAVEMGIVQRFNDYASAVDEIQRAGAKAVCQPYPH